MFSQSHGLRQWPEGTDAVCERGKTDMAQNPIRFQAGMSLSELFSDYGSEAQCEAALEQARWPHGFECRYCGE